MMIDSNLISPNWVYIGATGVLVTVLGLMLRGLIAKFIDNLFKPIEQIQHLQKDVEALRTRIIMCESSQDNFSKLFVKMNDDLDYIRKRIDSLIDSHIERDR